MSIPFLYDAELLARGIQVYHSVDLDSHPHLLCVGATNSGKSYGLSLYLGKIAKYEPTTTLVICDFKKGSFGWLEGQDGFYGYTDCVAGIDAVYAEFTARLEANDAERNSRRIVLLVDEYAALVSSLDKKSADDLKQKIGNMLMQGRSLKINIVTGLQRADSSYFHSGARDQYTAVLMLGNLSKEQKSMLAYDYRDEMDDLNAQGEGYLLLDGRGLFRVQVPHVTDTDKLRVTIARCVSPPYGGVCEATRPTDG